jgi:hypothetical protein
MRMLLLSILLPLIPLYGMLILEFMMDTRGILIIASIVYLTLWLLFFIFMLCNVNEAMVVERERIQFINPYCEKVLPVNGIRTIYYNDGRGLSFRMSDNSEKRFSFKFDFDGPILEDHFRRLSELLDFEEEHIRDSNIYCLVNNRIR